MLNIAAALLITAAFSATWISFKLIPVIAISRNPMFMQNGQLFILMPSKNKKLTLSGVFITWEYALYMGVFKVGGVYKYVQGKIYEKILREWRAEKENLKMIIQVSYPLLLETNYETEN